MPDWSWPEFEWDDGNVEHLIERHNVAPEEAEQVFYNGARVRRDGDVYRVGGQDDAGRYLFIVCDTRRVGTRDQCARHERQREGVI